MVIFNSFCLIRLVSVKARPICKLAVVILLRIAVYSGLAIDAVRQKLYYADEATSGGSVGELSTDGTGHRILFTDVDSRPRGVVIDVISRYSIASTHIRIAV